MFKKGEVTKRKTPRKGRKLTRQQRTLVNAYFENGRIKARAMRTAGYAASTIKGASSLIFAHPNVKEEIERREEALRRKYDLNEDWVNQRLARIANGGEILAKYRVINDDGTLAWDFTGATQDDLAVITELTTDEYSEGRGADKIKIKKMKVAMADPKGALDSLARTMGMFKDKTEITGELSIVERLQRGKLRAGVK